MLRIKQKAWTLGENPMQAIRAEVFIDEQKVPQELEWDEEDAKATHLLATMDEQAIATIRMLSNGHIGRMAVLKQHRKQGVGKALLAACEALAIERKLKQTKLHAQEHAIGFYEKQGYKVISEIFIDAGIPHKTMVKTLSAQALPNH